MRLAALRQTEMTGELTLFPAAESSEAGSLLGCSPNDTSRAEVVGELDAEFQRVEDQCSWLEWSAMRICDLLLGPPPSRAQLANRLDEAAGQLTVERVARWEVDAEREARQTLTVRVLDMVLGSADGPSSLVASMSTAA
jgi:hypothetical protein